jgi:co-chaperonin GroES (HSP10)
MFRTKNLVLGFALAAGTGVALNVPQALAQSAQAPRQSGTVKTVSGGSFVLTTAAGQDVTVTVPDTAKVLVVAPGAKDLKSATSGTAADVAQGDRVIVSGSSGDTAQAMTAMRVILMKQSAIAETHAAQEAAWTQGAGGIVKTVSGSTVVISSGQHTITINTTPQTVVRRYSGDSVRFQDATLSTLSAIAPGDQLRVRGTKSADGATITADEIVAGTFRNYSGLLTTVDGAAGTVSLKDLATKKLVTVLVTANSDVHRLPPQVAQMIAVRLKSGAAGASGAGGEGAGQRMRAAGGDLSAMIARLPTETLAGLKPGEAVMIVATSPSAGSDRSTAVTLLTGVDPILQASPAGEMTISPWSLGGDASGGDASGGGGGGR